MKTKILKLTEKQIARVLDSLKSTATLRGERESLYLKKIAMAIKEQTT